MQKLKLFNILLCLFLLVPLSGQADTEQDLAAAREALDTERPDQALEILQKIEPLDRQEAAQVDQLIGEIYLTVGKPAKALEFFEQAVTSVMEDGVALAGLAEASLGVGKVRQAKSYAENALREDHDLVRAHLVLAKLEAASGSTYQAKARLEKLLEQKAGNEDVAIAYAVFLNEENDFDKAAEVLDKFTRTCLTCAKAMDVLGRLYWLNGYERKAVTIREKAGKLYQQKGNNYRAEAILNWVLANKKTAKRRASAKGGSERDPNIALVRQLEPLRIPAGYKLNSSGSGFIAMGGRYVITNHHVTNGAARLIMRNGSGEVREGRVVKYSPQEQDDIAVVELDQPYDESYSVELETMGDPVPGRSAVPIGYPLGMYLGVQMPAISQGNVSKTVGSKDDPRRFQYTASANKGSSGGPIFDTYGNLIGIVVAGLDKASFLKNAGFIPGDVNLGIKISRLFEMMNWQGGQVIDTSDQEEFNLEGLYQEMLPKTVFIMNVVRQ